MQRLGVSGALIAAAALRPAVSASSSPSSSSSSCLCPTALTVSRRALIEHSADPKKWRNAENEEIRRRFQESNFGGLGGGEPSYPSHQRSAGTTAEKGDGAAGATSTSGTGARPAVGVPLGSERINQEEYERILREKDLTDWNQVTYVSIVVALLLVGLNLLMDVVKPNPSPEYVPYVPPAQRKAAEGSEEPAK